MKRSLIIFVLIAFAAGYARAQGETDLTIKQISPTIVRIEYTPSFAKHSYRTPAGREIVQFQFPGEVHPEGPEGSVIVPYRSVPLELGSPQASLQILASDYTVVKDVDPLTRPELSRDPQFGVSLQFAEPGSIPAAGAEEIVALATLHDVARRGPGFEANVHLSPVIPDPASRSVKLYTRIVIEVRTGSMAGPAPRPSIQLEPSPLAQGSWYKMEIGETGIYKIDRQFLLNAGIPSGLVADIQSLRILGTGGAVVPEDLSTARPNTLEELPRRVVDRNGNGVFDPEDQVLFFARSPRMWTYDSLARTFRHRINPFGERSVYFLSVGGPGGKGMDSVASTSIPNAFRAPDFLGRSFLEQESTNLITSGRQWFGQMFDTEARSAVYTTLLPGLVAGSTVQYRVVVLSRAPTTQWFQFEENGHILGSVALPGVVVSSIEGAYASRSPVMSYSYAGAYPDARSLLKVVYQTSGSSPRGWLDWFEILYRRSFAALNDELQFSTYDTSAVVEYELSGFSSRQIEVFDVTDHASVLRVTGLQFNPVDPTRVVFQLTQNTGMPREIIAVTPSAYKTPPVLSPVPNSDLRGIQTGAEYVIITPEAFQSEAERLRAHRAQTGGPAGMVVPIEHIFNEYGGGMADPTAVRDFLLAARTQWQVPPRYVLLFGDGHYDYKGILTTERNWIPPYESDESIVQILSYASDDFFVLLDEGNPRVSLAAGRIPVGSAAEAATVVDKIISYESNRSFDSWKTRVTYVADDGLTSTGDDGTIHTVQADALAQTYTPAMMDKRKIYIVGYPTVSSASGRRKPEANKAIIDAINRGTLMINYTGHGNPEVWAHEWVFTREESLPKLTNRDRLTFLVAATCDFARYDNPLEQSAGEEIFVMNGGGSVGVMTSSRAVYSFQNAQFNNTFYTEVFKRDSAGSFSRLGDAMYRTKQILYGTNDLKYHLFADPAMRLAVPEEIATVDSVNGSSLAITVDVPTLGTMKVDGRITRPDGSERSDFNGRALLELYDAKQRILVPEWGSFSYEVNGSILYRGEVSVTGGRFSGVAPVPKDVSYGENPARIAVYAWDDVEDATGFTERVRIAGTDTTVAVDTTGPRMAIYFNDEAFRSGDVTPPGSSMLVMLEDESGINTSTAGIGHRLEARFSALAQPVDLTDYYRSNLDTYQGGRVSFVIPELPEGRQSVRVKAWDTRNNSSEEELFFEVRAASDLDVYNVMNFPNPFNRSTRFTFQRSSSEPIRVEIKVYTVAGRLIQILELPSTFDRFVEVEWDGRDRDGNEIANGVYFYKVITRSLSGGDTREVIGKLAVLR